MKLRIGLITMINASLFCGLHAFAQSATLSSFHEVKNVLQDHNLALKTDLEKAEFQAYQSQKLPVYPVNSASIFSKGSAALEKDAKRTISESEDYYDRIEKKIHSNGVCVTGTWKMTEKNEYSGYFSQDQEGLFVGRISVTMDSVMSGDKRGFGLAGKIFPTMNPNAPVKTANFFTVDILLGSRSQMLDVKTTNEPSTGFSLSLLGLGLKIAAALKTADENPSFRPLYPVAEAGLSDPNVFKQPRWMRLSVGKNTIKNAEKDFRNEVLRAIHENKKGLVYNVDVSDTTKDSTEDQSWKKVGEIRLTEAMVSYGCDRRLHFAHPKLNRVK